MDINKNSATLRRTNVEEVSQYMQKQVLKVAKLLLHFPSRKAAKETLKLLIMVRSQSRSLHDALIVKDINKLLDNTSIIFSHASLSLAVERTKAFYLIESPTFSHRASTNIKRQILSAQSAPTGLKALEEFLAEQKAHEDDLMSKCSSEHCPLLRMLDRHIAVVVKKMHFAINNRLSLELREWVVGFTLIGEGIFAKQVHLGEWKRDACQCG